MAKGNGRRTGSRNRGYFFIKDCGWVANVNGNRVPLEYENGGHMLCAFSERNDPGGMAEFLDHSGQAKNPSLWLVSQVISEILPDGEKENNSCRAR